MPAARDPWRAAASGQALPGAELGAATEAAAEAASPLAAERNSPARVAAWGPWAAWAGLGGWGKARFRPEPERWAVKELGWEDRGMLERKGMHVCRPGGRCRGRPEGVIMGNEGTPGGTPLKPVWEPLAEPACSLPSTWPRGRGCLLAACTVMLLLDCGAMDRACGLQL